MAQPTSILSECTLIPAYGRDYRNSQDALAAFYDGKDFVLVHYTGQCTYCSIRNFQQEGVTEATIRYNQMADFVIAQIPLDDQTRLVNAIGKEV
jgi:hypothetical protein